MSKYHRDFCLIRESGVNNFSDLIKIKNTHSFQGLYYFYQGIKQLI